MKYADKSGRSTNGYSNGALVRVLVTQTHRTRFAKPGLLGDDRIYLTNKEKSIFGAITGTCAHQEEELVRNAVLQGRLGCSDQEMVFTILRIARRAHSKLTALTSGEQTLASPRTIG